MERDFPRFARLTLTDAAAETLVVDLAEDAPQLVPPILSALGPTIAPEESAGHKTPALFGRAEPRDFVDVRALALLLGHDRLVELAAERDPGLVLDVLATMIDQLEQIGDDELDMPADDIPETRAFFARWASDLRRDDETPD